MRTMTARNLKNKTGEAMQVISKGEKVIVTLRGKPFALISPVTVESLERVSLRQPEDAWKDIEDTLKKSTPKFRSAKKAMSWTRRR